MTQPDRPPVVVRRAEHGDVAAFLALRLQWLDEEATPEFSRRFRAWFEQEWPTRWWWLALDDLRPVGMVNLKLFARMPTAQQGSSRWGYLCNLFVSPTQRADGVGRRLVAALLSSARDEDLVRVVVNPSGQSVPLYQRSGFSRSHGLLSWHPDDDGSPG